MTSALNPKNPDATPPTTQNGISNQTINYSTHDIPPTYERQIVHAVEIKFINDYYITPVTIEFGSFDSDNSVIFLWDTTNYWLP